jgi:hypothetical protein
MSNFKYYLEKVRETQPTEVFTETASNETVIKNFLDGIKGPKSGHLRIENVGTGLALINYNTIIAFQWKDGVDEPETREELFGDAPSKPNYIYLNKSKYSRTTSAIQSKIRYRTPESLLKEVSEEEIYEMSDWSGGRFHR